MQEIEFLSASNYAEIQTRVKAYLAKGWRLHTFTVVGGSLTTFYAVLVKPLTSES